jgi:hypothetical protein
MPVTFQNPINRNLFWRKVRQKAQVLGGWCREPFFWISFQHVYSRPKVVPASPFEALARMAGKHLDLCGLTHPRVGGHNANTKAYTTKPSAMCSHPQWLVSATFLIDIDFFLV